MVNWITVAFHAVPGKKEALANVGGLLCCNDDALYEQLRNLTIVVEGYPTYVLTCRPANVELPTLFKLAVLMSRLPFY